VVSLPRQIRRQHADFPSPTTAIQPLFAARTAAHPGEPRRRAGTGATPAKSGFNPADPDDARLFAAVLPGEHVIAGFRNRHVREALFGATDDPVLARRHAARVTRLFNRLHAHGYIAKIPRTRRWRVTDLGRAAMSAVIDVRENAFPTAFSKAAA
jgi:hypothetical protein